MFIGVYLHDTVWLKKVAAVLTEYNSKKIAKYLYALIAKNFYLCPRLKLLKESLITF